MKPSALKKLTIDSLEDMKGLDIACLEVKDITSITDYMIVVTGTSNRHLNSLAETVAKNVKAAGGTILGTEGQKQSDWVLLDLGDVIVHIMLEATRALYDLEALWSITEEKAE